MSRLTRKTVLGTLLAGGLVACAQLPPPEVRPIITYTGARLQAEPEEMVEVEEWVQYVMLEMDQPNPPFRIERVWEPQVRYPWDGIQIESDSAAIPIAEGAPDSETPYLIYAFLRLMQDMGGLEEWVPGVGGRDPYEIEEAILLQISDVWLLGRTVFDTAPFGPLDELLYASEKGFLKDFILATQGERFAEVAERHRVENPGREEEFREFFLGTFEREGPGFLAGPEGGAPAAAGDPPTPDPA